MSNEQYKLSDSYNFIGIAHSHPLALSVGASIPDIKLQGIMQKELGKFVSVIINPQKKQIAAYYNSVFYPVDVEITVKNDYELTEFNPLHSGFVPDSVN